MDGLCPATVRFIEHPIKSATMLNTRYPCPALDPYNNSNVREIALLAVANRKSKPDTVLKNISTTDNCLWKRERDREREREGGIADYSHHHRYGKCWLNGVF